MPLDTGPDKPRVFVSFAGEDAIWVEDFLRPDLWSTLRAKARMETYKERPVLGGEISDPMRAQVAASVVFMPILSKYYVHKNSKIIAQDEFIFAVETYAKRPKGRRLFYPIIIDTDGNDFWSEMRNPVFSAHPWLKVECRAFRDLMGPITPERAEEARQVQALAEWISGLIDLPPPPEDNPDFVLLGNLHDVGTDAVAADRLALKDLLVERRKKVAVWDNGWLTGERRRLGKRWPRFIQPLDASGAIMNERDTAPDDCARFVDLKADIRDPVPAGEVAAAPPVTLWLPSNLAIDPLAAGFVRRWSGPEPTPTEEAAGTAPRLPAIPRACVASAQQLADWLAPPEMKPAHAATNDLSSMIVEMLDDKSIVAHGNTAQEIVESRLRKLVIDAAQGSGRTLDPDDIWIGNFVDPRDLASQLSNTMKDARIIVANDSTLQRARDAKEARKSLREKVRLYSNSLGTMPVPSQVLPVFVVISNFEYFKDQRTLDAFLAGEKWRVLSLARDDFAPDPSSEAWLIDEINHMLT